MTSPKPLSGNSRQPRELPRVDVIIGLNPRLGDSRTSYDLRMYQEGFLTKLDLNRHMLRGVGTPQVLVQPYNNVFLKNCRYLAI